MDVCNENGWFHSELARTCPTETTSVKITMYLSGTMACGFWTSTPLDLGHTWRHSQPRLGKDQVCSGTRYQQEQAAENEKGWTLVAGGAWAPTVPAILSLAHHSALCPHLQCHVVLLFRCVQQSFGITSSTARLWRRFFYTRSGVCKVPLMNIARLELPITLCLALSRIGSTAILAGDHQVLGTGPKPLERARVHVVWGRVLQSWQCTQLEPGTEDQKTDQSLSHDVMRCLSKRRAVDWRPSIWTSWQ